MTKGFCHFANTLRLDTEVQKIDAFICTFPASMCQLWLAMNKSIVFLPAHRYNLGRCTPEDWHHLDNDLYKMAADPLGDNYINILCAAFISLGVNFINILHKCF